MKKQLKSILLITLLVGMAFPAWGQTSTQGKEFWVSLVPSQYAEADNAEKQKASDSNNKFQPYIAISAQKACNVKISNPRTGWFTTVSVNANEWKEVGKNGEIPIAQWYTPDAMPTSETPYDLGLKVEATEDVSVYCSLRWGFSADATNILPTTALQSEYIVQTYEAIKQNITFDGSSADQPKTEDNDFNGVQKNSFTILAAENCVVDIELSAKTSGGKTDKIENISLQQGQVYHVLSAVNQSLSGSRVVARNKKKIAVFAGAPSTRLPNAFSDRDLLYEQLFPIDYWGNNFVVVRSKQKDANRIIITAQENNTSVTIHGQYDPSTSKFDDHTIQKDYTFTLDAGKSYEFEMSAGYADERWHKKRSAFKGITVIDTAAYISTSCPCAVISYDVGNKYVRSDGTEVVTNSDGDNCGAPAMTWIAPIEQMLNDVVFGVMGTDKTTKHFVNIIVNTSDVSSIKLNNVSISSNFFPVENNPNYSYARIKLRETTDGGVNPFYHLTSNLGFIATVYGNGHNESYSYTAGSSAVKRGVKIESTKFIDQMRGEEPFCVDDVLQFDPRVSTDIIDQVVWDFGDGITETTTIDEGIVAEHQYTTPGWYDVTALISAHKECPLSTYPAEEIHFSFYVARADTSYVNPGHDCLSLEEQATKTEEEIAELLSSMHNDTLNKDTRVNCYDPVFIQPTVYGKDTYREFEERAVRDSVKIGDKWYYAQPGVQDIPDTIPNSWGCDSIMLYHMRITTSLDFALNEQSAETCEKEDVSVPYTYRKGEIGEAWMIDVANPDKPYEVENLPTTLGTGDIVLPAAQLKAGKYNMELCLVDAVFGDTVVCPFTLLVLYPADIFKIKFGNVLAVYNSKYNGGYNFTGFQWFMNGDTIPGATQSVYHSDSLFTVGDEFYVELTDQNGMKLQSCPQTLTATSSVSEKKDVPAEKILQDRHLYIRKDDALYDIYGQRVK